MIQFTVIAKKAIWHLAIWQNWCFGQFYHSKIAVFSGGRLFWWNDRIYVIHILGLKGLWSFWGFFKGISPRKRLQKLQRPLGIFTRGILLGHLKIKLCLVGVACYWWNNNCILQSSLRYLIYLIFDQQRDLTKGRGKEKNLSALSFLSRFRQW